MNSSQSVVPIKFWNRITFAFLVPLMRDLTQRSATLGDLKSHAQSDVGGWEEKFDVTLPAIRQSVFGSLVRKEKRIFWVMFFIHALDVSISIVAAFLSLQILKAFEAGAGFNLMTAIGVKTENTVPYAVALAFIVYGFNVTAAMLHAQKIERENLLSYRLQSWLSSFVYQFMMRINRASKQKIATGEIVNFAQSDVKSVSDFFAHAFVDFPVLLFSVGAILVFMHQLIGNAAYLALVIVLTQVPVSGLFSALISKLNVEMMRRSDKRVSLVTQWVQGSRVVRYFGWNQHAIAEIKAATRSEYNQDLKEKFAYCFSFGFSSIWWMVVCISVYGWFLWQGKTMSASQVFGTMWFTSVLGHQLNPLPWFVVAFSTAKVSQRRLISFFKNPLHAEELALYAGQNLDLITVQVDDTNVKSDYLAPGALGYKIQNLSLTIEESRILDNVTIIIPPAQITAIVGSVGSGKSLLMQVLMGEVIPTEGHVMVTGSGANDVLLHQTDVVEALRNRQCVVPQQAYVAGASVRENIPLKFDNLSSDADVVQALYDASLTEDIRDLPNGLSTVLGDKGVNLSGGQRQRLSLARAAFAVANQGIDTVFLDDPLSAVDSKTEAALVRDLLQHRFVGKTVVWATHRLDFIDVADQVVAMDTGRVLFAGTPAEYKKNGTQSL